MLRVERRLAERQGFPRTCADLGYWTPAKRAERLSDGTWRSAASDVLARQVLAEPEHVLQADRLDELVLVDGGDQVAPHRSPSSALNAAWTEMSKPWSSASSRPRRRGSSRRGRGRGSRPRRAGTGRVRPCRGERVTGGFVVGHVDPAERCGCFLEHLGLGFLEQCRDASIDRSSPVRSPDSTMERTERTGRGARSRAGGRWSRVARAGSGRPQAGEDLRAVVGDQGNVCSNCALRCLSLVTTVQSSSHMSHS